MLIHSLLTLGLLMAVHGTVNNVEEKNSVSDRSVQVSQTEAEKISEELNILINCV